MIIIEDAWGNNHALVVEQLTWDYKAGAELRTFLSMKNSFCEFGQ